MKYEKSTKCLLEIWALLGCHAGSSRLSRRLY